MMTETPWRIERDDHGTCDNANEDAHWRSLRPVDEYLAEHIGDMAAAHRLCNGTTTGHDIKRLDLEGIAEPEMDDYSDAVRETIESWYLDVGIARWCGSESPAELARIELVTGTGGPHTELIGQYSRTGELERVEAHQYWSGHREAWTDDSRVLEIFAAFVEAFIEPA